MFETQTINEHKAIIVHYEDGYTIYSPGKGGAIISNENKSVAISEWKIGMQIFQFAKKVLQIKNQGV